MKEADRRAIEEIGIPGLVLMENAARGCFEAIHQVVGEEEFPTMLVLCGGGNNGGDGLAIARHAAIHEYQVTCLLFSAEEKLSDDAALQLRILRSFDVEIIHVRTDAPDFSEVLPSYSAVVDALLGTGATGEPRSPYREGVLFANELEGLKVAVDIPTGLDADSGETASESFHADITVTMAALKPGLMLCDGPDLTGEILVADIGAPEFLYQESKCQLIDEDVAFTGLAIVDRRRHKYDRGKALILAGSRAMPGAAVLTASGAMAGGAGLVVLGSPASALPGILPKLAPEIMMLDVDDIQGEFAADAFAKIVEELDRFRVIAIGPGIGRRGYTQHFVREAVQNSPLPLILDADGLNAFVDQSELLQRRKAPLIITPHYGELGSLLGTESAKIGTDPLEYARSAAKQFEAIVVLKGSPTVVAVPEGEAWINSTGNPGMATAGSGDVVTGMVTGLVAGRNDNDLLPGVLAAVYLHSRSGDIAAEELSPHGIVASDLLNYLPHAFAELS